MKPLIAQKFRVSSGKLERNLANFEVPNGSFA